MGSRHKGRVRRFGILCLLAAGVGGAARAAADDPLDPGATADPPVFDPWRGIDPDGRIPAIVRPADLPNPERWRYIPEGRLKPGNVFQRFLVSSMIAPFVFYDGDVGVGFGVALVDIDFREQRRREFAGAFLSYTTEGQQNYTFVWRRWLHHRELPGGGVLQEERSLLRAAGGYSRSLTRRFFGIGPKTNESDETSYRDSRRLLRARPRPRAAGSRRRPRAEPRRRAANGTTSGTATSPASPTPRTSFPRSSTQADPSALGTLHAGIRWDTRDSQINPYHGWFVAGDVDAALLQEERRRRRRLGRQRRAHLPRSRRCFHDGGDPGRGESLRPTCWRWASDPASRPAICPSSRCRASAARRIGAASSPAAGATARAGTLSLEYRFWLLPRGFPIPFTDAIRVERFGAALFYEAGAVAKDGVRAVREPRALELRHRTAREPRARGALPRRRRLLGGRRQRLRGLRLELLNPTPPSLPGRSDLESSVSGCARKARAGRMQRHRFPYLPALDGIRGLAVAAVLAFHGGSAWASGGFLGVSTFFTLSGFLITSLLLDEYQVTGRIGLVEFWTRRFRRLMPAALLTLSGVALYGALLADPQQLWRLRADSLASLFYFANWQFMLSGRAYEELFGRPSPVQHFWSLSIEEQFYLVFPLLFLGLCRWAGGSRARLGGALGALAAASLVLTACLHQPEASFDARLLRHRHARGRAADRSGARARDRAAARGVRAAGLACAHRGRARGADAFVLVVGDRDARLGLALRRRPRRRSRSRAPRGSRRPCARGPSRVCSRSSRCGSSA